jgi:hypothetical protein
MIPHLSSMMTEWRPSYEERLHTSVAEKSGVRHWQTHLVQTPAWYEPSCVKANLKSRNNDDVSQETNSPSDFLSKPRIIPAGDMQRLHQCVMFSGRSNDIWECY